MLTNTWRRQIFREKPFNSNVSELNSNKNYQLFVCRSCHEYSRKMDERTADTCPFPPRLAPLCASNSSPRTPAPSLRRPILIVAYHLHNEGRPLCCCVCVFFLLIIIWKINGLRMFTCVRAARKRCLCVHPRPKLKSNCRMSHWIAIVVRVPNATNEWSLFKYCILLTKLQKQKTVNHLPVCPLNVQTNVQPVWSKRSIVICPEYSPINAYLANESYLISSYASLVTFNFIVNVQANKKIIIG